MSYDFFFDFTQCLVLRIVVFKSSIKKECPINGFSLILIRLTPQIVHADEYFVMAQLRACQ